MNLNQKFIICLCRGISKRKYGRGKKLEEKLDILAEYGSNYVALRNLLEFETEQLTKLNQKLKEARVDAEQSLTHTLVVNNASVPDRKHSPKRAIIVIVSTISALLLTFVTLIFVDLLKNIKTTEK
jgi:uncharacterized protein involved in exopolysaccharide biosynthesis